MVRERERQEEQRKARAYLMGQYLPRRMSVLRVSRDMDFEIGTGVEVKRGVCLRVGPRVIKGGVRLSLHAEKKDEEEEEEEDLKEESSRVAEKKEREREG